jgi:hypothetical protein
VLYLIDLEKKPVIKDEMKDGFSYIETVIDAEIIKDKVDEDATNKAVAERKERL